jgi:NhaP-type Na+/H+ or K+/H+ antiporter
LIIAWTGTRGVLSLAAALALPLVLRTGKAFPQRHLILFLAFVVIFVTLVVQGLEPALTDPDAQYQTRCKRKQRTKRITTAYSAEYDPFY